MSQITSSTGWSSTPRASFRARDDWSLKWWVMFAVILSFFFHGLLYVSFDKISMVRRMVAADCVGTIAWVLDIVAQDLRRTRRGGAKAESERIRLRFGELRIQAFAVRSAVYRTARLADAGHNVVNETIAAKVLAAEAANQITDVAIQLVGGEALVSGHPLEAICRRMRGLRLAEGESDTLRVNLSRGYLDLGKGRI